MEDKQSLKKTMQDAIVDSRKGQIPIVKKILEEHLRKARNIAGEFASCSEMLRSYEELVDRAVQVASKAHPQLPSEEDKKAVHDLVVKANVILDRLKQQASNLEHQIRSE